MNGLLEAINALGELVAQLRAENALLRAQMLGQTKMREAESAAERAEARAPMPADGWSGDTDEEPKAEGATP